MWISQPSASFATNHLRSFQECIVVCVISLEDINVTPETVPYPQCREVRTTTSPTNHMDKITIAASAAICGTVLIAVIIFIAASRRRSRKLDTLQAHHNGKVSKLDGSLGCFWNLLNDELKGGFHQPFQLLTAR
jgi:hypothetical protein